MNVGGRHIAISYSKKSGGGEVEGVNILDIPRLIIDSDGLHPIFLVVGLGGCTEHDGLNKGKITKMWVMVMSRMESSNKFTMSLYCEEML